MKDETEEVVDQLSKKQAVQLHNERYAVKQEKLRLAKLLPRGVVFPPYPSIEILERLVRAYESNKDIKQVNDNDGS